MPANDRWGPKSLSSDFYSSFPYRHSRFCRRAPVEAVREQARKAPPHARGVTRAAPVVLSGAVRSRPKTWWQKTRRANLQVLTPLPWTLHWASLPGVSDFRGPAITGQNVCLFVVPLGRMWRRKRPCSGHCVLEILEFDSSNCTGRLCRGWGNGDELAQVNSLSPPFPALSTSAAPCFFPQLFYVPQGRRPQQVPVAA